MLLALEVTWLYVTLRAFVSIIIIIINIIITILFQFFIGYIQIIESCLLLEQAISVATLVCCLVAAFYRSSSFSTCWFTMAWSSSPQERKSGREVARQSVRKCFMWRASNKKTASFEDHALSINSCFTYRKTTHRACEWEDSNCLRKYTKLVAEVYYSFYRNWTYSQCFTSNYNDVMRTCYFIG